MDWSEAFERICMEIARIRAGSDARDDVVRSFLSAGGQEELTFILEDFVVNFWEEIDTMAAGDEDPGVFDLAALRTVSEGALSRAVVLCLELVSAERIDDPDPLLLEAARHVASFWLRHGAEIEEEIVFLDPDLGTPAPGPGFH